jgi:hypothetical protein
MDRFGTICPCNDVGQGKLFDNLGESYLCCFLIYSSYRLSFTR